MLNNSFEERQFMIDNLPRAILDDELTFSGNNGIISKCRARFYHDLSDEPIPRAVIVFSDVSGTPFRQCAGQIVTIAFNKFLSWLNGKHHLATFVQYYPEEGYHNPEQFTRIEFSQIENVSTFGNSHHELLFLCPTWREMSPHKFYTMVDPDIARKMRY